MVVFESLILVYSVGILVVVLLNLIYLPKVSTSAPTKTPKVSVLIPARNEERNLSLHLPRWLSQDYPNYEILVLDDESEDSTNEVLQHFSEHIVILKGKPLPQDWLGKNWACHQLSKCASGEIFLFADADVAPEKQAISYTINTLHQYNLQSLSAFLKQSFTHWSSKAVIPWALQFPILAWAPLFLSRFYNFSSLAIGNGQWFVFERECYFAIGGHEAVKSSVVEDMSLAQQLVHHGLRYQPLIGPELATVSMYCNTKELVEGLTKNLSSIFGSSLMGNLFFFLLFLLVLSSCTVQKGLFFMIILTSFYLVQFFFKQKNVSLLIVPLGLLMTLWLFSRSMIAKKRKSLFWKGRPL